MKNNNSKNFEVVIKSYGFVMTQACKRVKVKDRIKNEERQGWDVFGMECIKVGIHNMRSTRQSCTFTYKSLLKWLGRSWCVRHRDQGKFPQGDSCGLRRNRTYRQILPTDRTGGGADICQSALYPLSFICHTEVAVGKSPAFGHTHFFSPWTA